MDIRTHGLTEICDLVDKADLHGQEAIGGIFRQFGRLAPRKHQGRIAQGQRLVESFHDLPCALVVASDKDPVRMGEIPDRRAFAQKFRVRTDGEFGIGPQRAQTVLDLSAGANWNGRFRGNDRETIQVGRKLFGGGEDMAQIRIAITTAHGRADGEKHQIGLAHCFTELGGKIQPIRFQISL